MFESHNYKAKNWSRVNGSPLLNLYVRSFRDTHNQRYDYWLDILSSLSKNIYLEVRYCLPLLGNVYVCLVLSPVNVFIIDSLLCSFTFAHEPRAIGRASVTTTYLWCIFINTRRHCTIGVFLTQGTRIIT